MRPWQSSNPAKIVMVISSHEILFDINLGWGVTIRQTIGLEYQKSYDANQRLFIKRRLENLLSTSNNVMIDMYWDDGEVPFCDILVGGQDIIDLIEQGGVLPAS